jgi:WhiB family redox-sensing transcriptional regulator
MEIPKWMDDANCANISEPDIFFDHTLTEVAKTICVDCPVKNECLLMALNLNMDTGVFGGLSEAERKLLKKARRSRKGIPNKQH